MSEWWWIRYQHRTGVVVIALEAGEHGRVITAPPIARWQIGRDIEDVLQEFHDKGAEIRSLDVNASEPYAGSTKALQAEFSDEQLAEAWRRERTCHACDGIRPAPPRPGCAQPHLHHAPAEGPGLGLDGRGQDPALRASRNGVQVGRR